MQKIYQVDTFTATPFSGNPAGVMIADEQVTSKRMQQIASEMNVSETAFLLPLGANHFEIRYFTPTQEIPLCGHATIASAHILFEKGLVNKHQSIHLRAQDTMLDVHEKNNQLLMKFPRYDITPINPPENFGQIAGFEPIAFYASQYNWKIALADSPETVKKVAPDIRALQNSGIDALMVTAKADSDPYDFIVRCFVPGMGIDEDPATGSAQCALGPLWSKKLHKNELKSIQWSKRRGELNVNVFDDHVIIRGQALTVFEIEALI